MKRRFQSLMHGMMARLFGRRLFGVLMLSCRDINELLDDYLDGNLDVDEKRSIDVHLRVCPECREYLRSYRNTVLILGSMPEEPMPEEFSQHLETLLLQRLNP